MGSTNGFTINPRFTLLNTTQNFDLNGQSYAFGNTAQRYYFDVNAAYGFTENFFLYGRLSALYTLISGNGINEQGNFGLSDQMAGTAYRLFQSESGVSFSLQGEVTLPAYDNSAATIVTKPYLGDGSIDMTFGGFLEVPVTLQDTYQLYLDAGAGYTYRSKGFSQAVPWNVQLKRYPTMEGLTFALGARGNISLLTDNTNISQSALAAGGSYLINAINPSWILAQATIGYQTENNIQYTLSSAYPVYGKSAPNPLQITLGFQFEFGQHSSNHPQEKRKAISAGSFRQYDLESKVTASNDQLFLLKVDKGAESGVEKGQIFDIFSGEEVIAKAKVTHVKNDESALRVIEYLKEQSVEIDSVARRVINRP